MTYYLTFENLVLLAENVCAPQQPGIRDAGLLQSAAARPAMTVFGNDAYATLPDKAAALMESIARNHCLIDGNKRLAWHSATVFMAINGVNLQAPTVDEGEAFVLGVAMGKIRVEDAAAQIAAWTTPQPEG